MENFVILMISKFLSIIVFQHLLNSSNVCNQSTHNILSDFIGKNIGTHISFCVRQPVYMTSVHLSIQSPKTLFKTSENCVVICAACLSQELHLTNVLFGSAACE